MLYKVLPKFGPEDGDAWTDYLRWRGLHHLTRFDSIDRLLRPDLFEPKSEEDWRHCVHEDFKLNLITNLGYARIVASRRAEAVVVGVEPDVDHRHRSHAGLLGYDLLDEDCSISLLTDWGSGSEGVPGDDIAENALVLDLGRALALRDRLREERQDAHAIACAVWAVYRVMRE